jgi:transcriptional regulator with XRE-family HTH domain
LVGENIRRIRGERSIMDLCADIGMSRAFWYDIEAGEKAATVDTLQRIADALGVGVQDLVSSRPRRSTQS